MAMPVRIAAVAAGLILASAALLPAPQASASARWAFCSSDPQGTWQPGNGRWFVQNEIQNDSRTQSICADSYHYWETTSRQAKGNTEVETYPDSQEVFGTVAGLARDPFSSYRSIRSTFSITMPAGRGISAEAAYDTWWGNGWDTTDEVMIWVNTVNRSLDGSRYLGTARIYGQVFSVHEYPSDGPGDPPEFVFRLDHNETSGTVHIQASVQWLVSRHYMKAGTALTAIPFGFEICSTGGVNRTFRVNSLSISTTRK